MIKLIATDLDGTLLNNNKQLPREIFPLIEELAKRNILFAPASGRQYENLKKLFFPVWEKLLFICENGALVKYKGETLFSTPIAEEEIATAVQTVRAIPHAFPLLCGESTAFMENRDEPFYTLTVNAYTKNALTENLDLVIGKEPICKISVYDEVGSAENCMKILPQALPRLRVIQSGFDWCDISAPDANKGRAVAFIRERFGLKKEECMAFGDHMNDYEMLLEVGQPFLPENAYPLLKEKFTGRIPSNEDGGVLIKIKEILEKNYSIPPVIASRYSEECREQCHCEPS